MLRTILKTFIEMMSRQLRSNTGLAITLILPIIVGGI